MKYKNVWISTRSHLDKFVEIYNSTSKFRRAISAYKVPRDYPHYSFYFGLLKAPVNHVGTGTLTITDQFLQFKGKDYFGKKPLEFTIDHTKNFNLDRYLFISPFSKAFQTNWIQIGTTEEHGELLISQGFTGFNLSYKARTEEIYNSILNWQKSTGV